MRTFPAPTIRTVAASLLCAAMSLAVGVPARAEDSARLISYEHEGVVAYALSLMADLPEKQTAATDVVVLFDTSASQTGAYRETALAALESLLSNLRPTDRVQLAAIDLQMQPLTEAFEAGDSAALQQAVAALRELAPLGSTDLTSALSGAAERFQTAESKHRAVIYIGDGVSTANLLDSPTLSKLIADMRSARIAVSSYAIGPQVDAELLAVLANQTGGNLFRADEMVWQDPAAGISDDRAQAENQRNGRVAGKHLARWSQAAVLWPVEIQIDGQMGATFPEVFPPLRSDRDTILVGRTSESLADPASIRVVASAGGDPVEVAWTFTAEPTHPDRAFLAELVDIASRNGGLTLPTVGSEGLAETARLIGARVDQLTMLAERAVATGDHRGASQFVQAVLKTEPQNVRARTVQNVLDEADPFDFGEPADELAAPAEAVEEVEVEAAEVKPAEVEAAEVEVEAAAPDGDIQLTRPAPAAAAAPAVAEGSELAAPAEGDSGLLSQLGSDGAFLEEVEQERRVFAEMLAKEVQNVVIDARERMTSEPAIVIQELKLSLDNVKKAADIDEARRAELVDQLEIALREAARQAEIKDELDRQREEQLAASRERKLLNQRLIRRIDRETQLMDRFNALMDERRYAEAGEVAIIVEEIDPDGVTPRTALVWERAKQHYYLQQVVRSARHQAIWDTLYQVELSHIPFPDSPPIVYPDAAVWDDLTNRRKKYATVDLGSTGEAEQRIEEALRSQLKAPLEFPETPLNQIMEILSTEYGIQIVLDTAALDALAVTPDTEISVNLRNISLRSALELMLKSPATEDLTYIIDNEVLLITSQDEAESRLKVKVYPVADLVLPIQDLGLIGGIGGGGGGGGLGGGGGGGGLGGGGGGGGFGGGGGGGQGGGGGGGFFAVPDDLGESVNQEADGADIVISLATAAEANPLTETAPPATDPEMAEASELRVAGVAIDLGQSPVDYWNAYFAAERRDLGAVRDAVRDLMKQDHPEHVIALISAALRHGQPQPWMYESLGIAMELDGRPASDIERAVMSACDFTRDPNQLLLIGGYLSHIGLDSRAVDVYRQVAKAAPLEHDAYALGLRAAQRCNDIDAIRWATLGILRQAWPDDQAMIRNTAFRVAKATLDELREAGETAVADDYEQQLNAALIRDCVVRISWSGEADVDLFVEEPGGTVCSLRAPRTPGGGVCLGDDYASEDQTRPNGMQETYVCSQAFPGEYRVRVRKVWGDLVADKVAVDVYKGYRSQDQQHERQYISVGEDDSVVLFTLENGRRNDPLDQQQLASAIERQQEISRAVLAQQIGSLADPSIVPDRAAARGLDLRRQLALAGAGGAVGFQPVIITLPQGTQMLATGVISADRRYVRITAAPSFTGIGNVTTFTFAGAAAPTDTNNNNAGGGGGGGGGGNQGGN